MASVRPRIPIKKAPGAAAVHVGIGTNMPTKGDPAQMLTMGALGTGETAGIVVDTNIQISAMRDPSEEDMGLIG